MRMAVMAVVWCSASARSWVAVPWYQSRSVAACWWRERSWARVLRSAVLPAARRVSQRSAALPVGEGGVLGSELVELGVQLGSVVASDGVEAEAGGVECCSDVGDTGGGVLFGADGPPGVGVGGLGVGGVVDVGEESGELAVVRSVWRS